MNLLLHFNKVFITRQEEIASTRSLLNTAKLMESNAMLLKLKKMKYMVKIAHQVTEITINGNGSVLDKLQKMLITEK